MIKYFLLTTTFLSASVPLWAEAEIQRFFARLEGYRLVMRWEMTDPGRVETRTPYSRELLEESGLTSASAWSIRSPQGAEFPLLVLETEDSSGAFLLFNRWRLRGDGPAPATLELPVGHLYSPRDAAFWRGNFFFRLGDRSASVSEAVFEAFVRDVFRAVTVENLLPVSVSHLPREELVPDSIRFYRGPLSLAENERFPEPLLETVGQAERIEIAFGRYQPDDALFLIGYPTPTLADEHFRRLQRRLQEFFSDEGLFMKRAGVLICLFVGPEDRALDVLNRVRYTPAIQWLHDKKPEREPSETVKFLRLLTRTFLGTGILLLVTVLVGVAAGLLRYQMLRRYPSLVRRKEMIRLKLHR